VETLPQIPRRDFQKGIQKLRPITPTTLLIADSTPLEDLYDLEAKWGYTSRGPFRSFKLHAVVNQLGLPMRAVVTPGNRYDSPLLPLPLEDLEAEYVLADVGYDSKRNIKAVEAMGAEPVIASNPRRGKRRKIRHGELLRAKRYVGEQFNGQSKTTF
jgi:transposase